MNRNKIEEMSSEYNDSIRSSFRMPGVFSKDIKFSNDRPVTTQPADDRRSGSEPDVRFDNELAQLI